MGAREKLIALMMLSREFHKINGIQINEETVFETTDGTYIGNLHKEDIRPLPVGSIMGIFSDTDESKTETFYLVIDGDEKKVLIEKVQFFKAKLSINQSITTSNIVAKDKSEAIKIIKREYDNLTAIISVLPIAKLKQEERFITRL